MNFKDKLRQKTTNFCKNSSGEDMTFKEVMGYSFAGFGQNLICGLIGSYLMYFMTDALGFTGSLKIWGVSGSMLVAYLMLGTRVFDAFNDPIMGSIVDRTRTKWGKCRPYLLWTPVPIAILTICCFLPVYPANATGYIAICCVYVLWSIVYTIIDVPYWGLSTAMSNDTDLRARILTVARLLCTAAAGLVTIIIPAITGAITKKYKDPETGELITKYASQNMHDLKTFFIIAAVICSVLAIPFFLNGFKTTKERYISTSEPPTLGHNLRLFFKNKPLVMVTLSGILGCARIAYTGVGTLYFAKYALKNEGAFSLITMLIVPGGLVASLMCPFLQKKFGKKWTYIVTHLVGGVLMFIMYFVGYKSTGALVFAAFCLVILGIPQGINNIMSYALIGDSVEYLEWKTGERGEGICFAMQTFINKMGLAATAFIGVMAYAIAGIDANNVASSVTEAGNDKLWAVIVLSGAISMIACTIPMFFYNFTEKKQKEVKELLLKRKAEEGLLEEKQAEIIEEN